MGRKKGEVSVSEAAAMLGSHYKTVQRHARNAVLSKGRSKFGRDHVRVDWSGRYWLKKDVVKKQAG